MIDKKDPRQDSAKDDSLNDDVIIDLTEEVIAQNEEDDGIIELQDNLTDEVFGSDNDEDDEDDEDLIVLEETSKPDELEKEVTLNAADQFADDKADMGEDELIASALNESLFLDEDEPDKQNEDFELKAQDDDDIIILDNEQDPADESLTETADENAITDGRGEVLFDFEDEIELEYELEEDENELIALDDERAEDQPDFFDIVLGKTAKSGRRDQSEEPTEYLELNAGSQNDSMDMIDAGDESPPSDMAMGIEAMENDDMEDLPDLSAVTDLEFEDDDESDNIGAGIEEETDSGDEIIARTVEQSLNSDDGNKRFKPAGDTESATDDDAKVISLDATAQEDEQFMALEDDEPLHFEDENGLLVDLEDVSELEEDDEIIPLDGSNDPDAEADDDIVEITEFDQHYSTDHDKMLEQAGILDAAGAEEDDFLELIEVEEDQQAEERDVAESSNPDEKSQYPELDNFFKEEPEEEFKHETEESVFKKASPDESVFPELEAENDENAPGQEAPVKNEPEEEPFDFNFDPSIIDKQIDGLDAFLSEDSIDEPEVASLPENYTPEENFPQGDLKAESDSDELAAFSNEQIDKAIERVINEKFSGRIENIIYEVIEKAVAKEIERLKGVLLGGSPPDDD